MNSRSIVEDASRIGEIIRFHRKKSELTQQAVADLSGIGLTPLKDVESGKMTVQWDTLIKICVVLNIRISFQSKLMSDFEERET